MERLLTKQGFSLIELMVTFVIIAVVIAGAVGGYRSFIQNTGGVNTQAKLDSNVKIALNLLEQDLNMAGFGLSTKTCRVAGENDQQTLAEADTRFDYNNDGDLNDTMQTDRIFIGNGWEILKDATDNGKEDGNLVASKLSTIATARETDGFFAPLSAMINVNDTELRIKNPDINFGAESNLDYDFTSDSAVLVFWKNTTLAFVEGHRVAGIAYTPEPPPSTPPDPATQVVTARIMLLSGESFGHSFPVSDSTNSTKVVPAIVWYVRMANSVPWLYRNEDKVIPNVVDFQLQYGFDINNDGLEWADTIPPAGNVDGVAAPLEKIQALKSVRTVIKISRSGGEAVKNAMVLKEYSQSVNLKN